MERKTKLHAPEGTQDLDITREFDLPLELLFKAYTEADIVTQWMGTRVLQLESRAQGAYRFETRDADGKLLFSAHGVIHDCVPDTRITRTFEMGNTSFPAQLEFLEFEALPGGRSKLHIHIVYRSAEDRANALRLPFAHGISMAHDRLQEIATKLT
ncbi:MAG: SRPBCC domain-containing protein [Flavobacteriales bacterium]